MTDKNKTPISYREFYKALLPTLKRNLHIILLNARITPERLSLCFAVKDKNGDIWKPRIIEYHLEIRKVLIFNSLLDYKPTMIDAATLLYMDEYKITSPS